MMEDDTCGKKDRKPMTKPCARCGKPIPYPIGDICEKFCEECHSKNPHAVISRKSRKKHPRQARNDDEKRKSSQQLIKGGKSKTHEYKHDILYDEPCFFCEFGCCSGTHKVYITVSGKSVCEELDFDVECRSVSLLNKEMLPALLDRDKFIVCCSHHGGQMMTLRRYHEEWTFDDVIEEVIRRCR